MVVAVLAWAPVFALDVARSDSRPLLFPRLFVREQLNGNVLFRISLNGENADKSIHLVDTTDSRLLAHAEQFMETQTWRLLNEATYPQDFYALLSYHYLTKRFALWLCEEAPGEGEAIPFEDLHGAPVPALKLELPVPVGEERKPIVLKIPVHITALGRVVFHKPEKRDDTPFHSAAYAALGTLIFTPPLYGSRPVSTDVVLPVVFKP